MHAISANSKRTQEFEALRHTSGVSPTAISAASARPRTSCRRPGFGSSARDDPAGRVDLDESVSMALLIVLESLFELLDPAVTFRSDGGGW